MRWSVLIISDWDDSVRLAEALSEEEAVIERTELCPVRELPGKTRANSRPDVVVLDETVVVASALRQIITYLRRLWPGGRILILGDGDLDRMIGAARANADGYLPRRTGGEEAAQMVDRATKGEDFVLRYGSNRESDKGVYAGHFVRARHLALEGLTPREREITSLVAEGMTNRELSDRLNISVETARWHVKNALRKLGLRDRTELVVHWHSAGEEVPERRWENLASC